MQLSANNTYTVPEGFTARITLEAVPILAKGWNPAGLYQQTVGTEYRLLTPEEHKFFLQNLDADRSGVEMYSMGTWGNCNVDSDYQTYRVPLSWVHPSKRSPLAKGRNLHNLTEAQVEVEKGWRLITEEEYGESYLFPIVEKWCDYANPPCWENWKGLTCNLHDRDFRIKSRLPVKPTPEQILTDWIATYDVKVGDLVRVTGKVKKSPWVGHMNSEIGKVTAITRFDAGEVDAGFWYSPLDLEKVTEKQVPLEKEDWEGEWYIKTTDGLRINKITYAVGNTVNSGSTRWYAYTLQDDGFMRSRDLSTWTPCTKTTYIPTPPNPINQAKNAEECPF